MGKLLQGAVLLILLVPVLSSADQLTPEQIKQVQEKVTPLLSEAVLVDAIKKQNAKHATLSQADIDRLDKQWREEVKTQNGPLTSHVIDNDLSIFLSKLKKGDKVYTEIFAMDNRGLNVGLSDVTSDYWQGDEPKWAKTFLVGADSIYADQIKYDESSQQNQAQISFTVADPATKKAIGAVTVGINVKSLTK